MFREHFNLSRWAIEHPALVRYLMVVLLLMGIGAYFQLGQDEDPPYISCDGHSCGLAGCDRDAGL